MTDIIARNRSWHWLSPKDQRHNNYIFWKDTTRREIRGTYKHLVCKGCRKIDENEALALGIEPDLKIRATSDLVQTIDGMICVTERFRVVLQENGIRGLSYIALPEGKYFLALPEHTINIDVEKAGFKYEGKLCSICGRQRGIYHFPAYESYEAPLDNTLICTPSPSFETGIGRNLWLLVSARTKRVLKENKITGIDYSSKL